MSSYVSFAPVIDRTAAENRSALPDAPCVPESRPTAARSVAADFLRRQAAWQLRLAGRLERPVARHLAAA